jgi:tRNA threonylcarbamoyl adenosine modification protein (Sua5/YciO/YrdC/YwlC family)
MYLRIHPQDPEPRKIQQVVSCLQAGGLIIYPTDTIYGIGCDIKNESAIQKLYRLKGVNEKTAQFAFVCNELAQFSQYAKSIDTPVFRTIKKCLPGAYTFILEASKEVPRLLKTKKNTIGLRYPNNKICNELVSALGNPIISTSIPEHEEVDLYNDPETFYDLWESKVDIIIDGGLGNIMPSTIVNFIGGTAEIVRKGAGEIEIFES